MSERTYPEEVVEDAARALLSADGMTYEGSLIGWPRAMALHALARGFVPDGWSPPGTVDERGLIRATWSRIVPTPPPDPVAEARKKTDEAERQTDGHIRAACEYTADVSEDYMRDHHAMQYAVCSLRDEVRALRAELRTTRASDGRASS